jgi:hypothetical protein
MQTIAVVANMFNECNALPGWLEMATSFADWVGVMHAGPQGTKSDDGTMEILEKWRVPVQFCAIDDGFGTVRTKTLRMVPPSIDWIMLLDADERFHRLAYVMTCSGESTPSDVVDDLLYDYGNPNYQKDGPRNKQVVQPYDAQIDFSACPSNFENLVVLGANLKITRATSLNGVYDQEKLLRDILEDTDLDAVKVMRRHWHDFSFTRPTQNWHTSPDFQMRLLRNHNSIYFAQDTRMHERVVGVNQIHSPNFTHGPFLDHYHIPFKRMESTQRGHDIAIYGAIDRGEKPPTRIEWKVSNKLSS